MKFEQLHVSAAVNVDREMESLYFYSWLHFVTVELYCHLLDVNTHGVYLIVSVKNNVSIRSDLTSGCTLTLSVVSAVTDRLVSFNELQTHLQADLTGTTTLCIIDLLVLVL